MKKFNTDHIRRRMRDQKGGRTFGPRLMNANGNSSVGSSSEKSMISSPPIRVPIPPVMTHLDDDEFDDDEEHGNCPPFKSGSNAHEVINLIDKENVVGQSTSAAAKPVIAISKGTRPRPPPLAVSVTMDENDEVQDRNNNGYNGNLDEIEVARSVTSNSQCRRENNTIDQSEDASSVWAIMEHYHEEEEEQSKMPPSDVASVENFPLEDDGLSLPTFSISGNSPSWSRNHHASTAIYRSQPSMPSPPTSSSSAAEPNLVTNDDDGVKEEEPKADDKGIRKIHWNVDPNGSLIQTSVYSFEESHVTEMEIIDVTNNNDRSTSEHRDILHERALFKSPDPQIKKLPGETSKPTTTPKIAYATPAKVRQQFLDEMLNVTDRVDDISSHHGSLLQQSMIDSVGQNLPSIEWSVTDPQSALKSKQINNAATVIVAPNTSETTEYLTATDDNPYVLRINELEQNLCEQRTNTDELQDRLKSRVTQLEQALRVTAATPRGTIIQQNPLQTLLERNQTLVKEVRFADQTCVELSSKNSSLEKQIKELKRKVAALEVENGDLRIMNSERASMDAERIEHLEKELNRNQSSPGNRIDDVLSTIEDAFEQWRDKKTSEETHHDDYDAYGAASTASDIFSETEKSFLKPTKSTHNDDGTMNDFNIKIFEFVRNLLTEKNHVSGRTEEESDGGLDEQSKSRIENEFLGRQLGQVQEKLESTQKLLEAEYSRNDELETQLKRGAETYVRLIDPLEKRLLAVSQATSSLPQELVDTDSRLFDLQKELAHAKASLSAIKRESERMLADRRLTVEMVTKSKDNEELMLTIQNSFLRMSQQYKKLEVDVGSVVGNLASRIESMTETISFLRSSLLFDNDTAEVLRRPEDIGTRHPSQSPVGRGIPVSDGHIQQGGLIYIDNDDDVLELMEEARSPRKFEINIPGDIDDLTLESLVKSVSVLSPISHAERFKEPLEAAIRECQRVRERSSKLKEEIEKHIMTIHHLEGEKKHLTNSLQQREEDCRLLKQTVDLSKQQLEALDAALKASELEKSQVTQLKNNEKEALERDNVKLHAEARRLQNQETTLTKLLQENESKLVRIKTELNMMTQAHDDLVDKLTRSEKEHTERKDAELREATMSLQQAKDDLSKLRKSNQELLELHSQDKEENSRLSSKIRYIESKQESLISDLEDRDLEMQYMKEDIRKERAELKSELSQKEQEISSLKTAVSSAKMKCQVEEEEKQALISKIQAVAKIRADSCDRLEVHGICNDLSSMFFNSEFVLPESATSAIKEIEGLVKGLPYICSQLEDLHKESLRLSEFELEINNRNKQLELLEGREDELRKQNDELFSLLHQADTRVEESLEQVKVMQDTLIEIEQQKNAALEQASNAQAEMFEVRSKLQDDVAKSQAELNEVMDKVDTSCRALKRITEERDTALAEVEKLTAQLNVKEADDGSRNATIQSLEQKCCRLREYIKKLTGKCSEWESSYDRQTKAIERLQDKNRRIATRYKELLEQKREQRRAHQQYRAKWSEERSNLHTVHINLERELEEIARELALPIDGHAAASN